MSNKKKIIIGSTAAVALAALVVTLLLVFNKEDSYRVIKVLDIDGTAVVERTNVGELQAYSGMTLQSGDTISVQANSMLVLQMDDDKYAYAEQNTVFSVVAQGTSRDSKTTIDLQEGALTCQVENKLSESSSYEINTQNSVMAIRGTVVRIEILEQYEWISMYPELVGLFRGNEKYDQITQVSVQEGTVSVSLRMPDGTIDKEVLVDGGKEVWVGGNDTDSAYITDVIDLQTNLLNGQAIEAYLAAMEGNPEICFSKEELGALLDELSKDGVYRVYFFSGDTLFGVQEVKAGETPQVPTLSPTVSGMWDIDFSKPVEETVYVYWRAVEE